MPTIKEKFKNPRLRLYDINKNFICELTGNSLRNSAYSIKRTKKINEIETLSFSIPYDNEYIGLGSCEYLIRHEFAWFIIKNISLSSSDVRVLEVECESNFTISKTIMCEEAELIGVSPIEMFEGIMAEFLKELPVNSHIKFLFISYNLSLGFLNFSFIVGN